MALKIKYIFSDIDGVLTDGKVYLDAQGAENKQICYRDLDSIAIGKKAGLEFVFVTGEDSQLAKIISKRFGIKTAFGAKDKLMAVKTLLAELNLSADDVCYIGDSNRDIPAMQYVVLGIAPADGAPKVRQNADVITTAWGGSGVLLEVVENIIDGVYDKGE